MKNKKLLKILGKKGRITIPYELRIKMGFQYNDILSFTETDDNTIIVKRERLCDCDKKNKNDEVTLLEFLNNLSPEQQRAALVHLSVKWANNQTNIKETEE